MPRVQIFKVASAASSCPASNIYSWLAQQSKQVRAPREDFEGSELLCQVVCSKSKQICSAPLGSPGSPGWVNEDGPHSMRYEWPRYDCHVHSDEQLFLFRAICERSREQIKNSLPGLVPYSIAVDTVSIKHFRVTKTTFRFCIVGCLLPGSARFILDLTRRDPLSMNVE